MTDNTPSAHQGLLFNLDRDQAKRLFGLREAAEFVTFVTGLRSELAVDQFVDLGDDWQRLHNGLRQLAANTADIQAPLDQIIAGGRPLGPPDEITIRLVRPDLVSLLAAETAKLTPTELAKRIVSEDTGEAHLSATIDLLTQVCELYDRAAAVKGAILFAAIQ